MSRKHYRKRKEKPAQVAEVKTPEPVPQVKQVSRGETIRPVKHGGYSHSFNFYEHTVYAKGAAR